MYESIWSIWMSFTHMEYSNSLLTSLMVNEENFCRVERTGFMNPDCSRVFYVVQYYCNCLASLNSAEHYNMTVERDLNFTLKTEVSSFKIFNIKLMKVPYINRSWNCSPDFLGSIMFISAHNIRLKIYLTS